MSKIMDIISIRLRDRGLVPIEINRLIKDVSNIIGREWHYTPTGLKQSLVSLGWDKYILDNYILELILLSLDDEERFEIYRDSVH